MNAQRIMIYPSQVIELPQEAQLIKVIKGTVWLTENAQDVILKAGDTYLIEQHHYPTILSGTQKQSAIINMRLHGQQTQQAKQRLATLTLNSP